eukprot:1145541-Pelagomonas_calceolata.AAC.3
MSASGAQRGKLLSNHPVHVKCLSNSWGFGIAHASSSFCDTAYLKCYVFLNFCTAAIVAWLPSKVKLFQT